MATKSKFGGKVGGPFGSFANPGSKPKGFEQSKKDKEPKGMKEGSKKEEAFDRKQAKGFKCGGMAKKK